MTQDQKNEINKLFLFTKKMFDSMYEVYMEDGITEEEIYEYLEDIENVLNEGLREIQDK